MASQDWFEKDFYAILGVPQDADAATIKKKYRKLARDLHPDHNVGDTKAEERFKEIGEAYAVLSDPEQRREYDAIRAMAHGGARFAPGGAGGGFEDIFANFGGGEQVRFGTGGAQPNIEDLLGQMFGGGGAGFPGRGSPGGFGSTAGPRAGADVSASTRIGFREAAEGSTVTLTSPELGRITARIPPGVKDGQKIRLRGKGRPGDPGAPAGDLILTVSVDKHPVFGRGTLTFCHPENRRVLAYIREHEGVSILCVANLSRFAQYVELDLSRYEGRTPVELIGRVHFPRIGELPYLLTLGPHDFFWFELTTDV